MISLEMAIVILFLGLIVGVLLGHATAWCGLVKSAISRGFAKYDGDTGKFTWREQHELKIDYSCSECHKPIDQRLPYVADTSLMEAGRITLLNAYCDRECEAKYKERQQRISDTLDRYDQPNDGDRRQGK